ncbi:MAG TPA: ReoY family proteolytic degradation factor [Bacillales bacterium]|nr:ReoY family proteolytic degradation factor [Bacillales bacterium]
MRFDVSLSEKKQFIHWFLEHYELKKRECIWLLNYLVSDDDLMENLHFIRHAEYCPKAIIMSTRCTQDVPFQYFKKHVMTVEPEKAFHDIRMFREETLYLQLNFKNYHVNPEYAAVLEENPFYDEQISDTYADMAESVITEAEKRFERDHLLRLVDMALDAEDEQWFYELTGKLHRSKTPFP